MTVSPAGVLGTPCKKSRSADVIHMATRFGSTTRRLDRSGAARLAGLMMRHLRVDTCQSGAVQLNVTQRRSYWG